MRKTLIVSAMCFGAAFCGWLRAQTPTPATPPARRPYDPSAPTDPPKGPIEIHIDQRCRILPDPNLAPPVGGKAPHPHHDGVVCHVEGAKNSSHVEEDRFSGQKTHQTLVKVQEQEYVLQNVYDQPAIFFVEHPVPKDWQVDSDPQPVSLVPMPSPQGTQIALFRVNADPHQIIRLHVGIRHVWPKPKAAPAPAAQPAGSPNPGGAPGGNKPT